MEAKKLWSIQKFPNPDIIHLKFRPQPLEEFTEKFGKIEGVIKSEISCSNSYSIRLERANDMYEWHELLDEIEEILSKHDYIKATERDDED